MPDTPLVAPPDETVSEPPGLGRAAFPSWSPESRFVLLAARVELDAAARAELRRLVRRPLDWRVVFAHASHNGVLPLVLKHLTAYGGECVPAEVMIRFQQKSREVAFHSLQQASELTHLVPALEAAAIPVIPFKGPVLAETVYGDVSYRSALDLDLLVHRLDFERAMDVLQARGYVPIHADHTPEERAGFIENLGGYDLARYDKLVMAELHWKFFPAFNALNFDMEAIWQRQRRVPFGDTEVRALAPEDLFLYLCIHGTKHGWAKLKWLCDVVGFLRVHPELDWDEVLRQARHLGVQRMVRLALLLARELMGVALPGPIDAWSRRDRTARSLARQVCTSWILVPPGAPPAGTDFWFHFRERERWRDRIPYALHNLRLAVAPSEKDRAFVQLPKALSALYLFVRPVRITLEKMRSAGS